MYGTVLLGISHCQARYMWNGERTSVDSGVSSLWTPLSVALSAGVARPETPFSSASIDCASGYWSQPLSYARWGGGCAGGDVDVCEVGEVAGVVCLVFGLETVLWSKIDCLSGWEAKKRSGGGYDCEVRVPK